jgi:hypothetical protein
MSICITSVILAVPVCRPWRFADVCDLGVCWLLLDVGSRLRPLLIPVYDSCAFADSNGMTPDTGAAVRFSTC